MLFCAILLNPTATWRMVEWRVFHILMWRLSTTWQNLLVKIGNNKVQKYDVTYMKTYLLKLVTSSANDFSHAYIFIILMPVITSFMVLILASVKAAVLLLRGETWAVSQRPLTTSPYWQWAQAETRDQWLPTTCLQWQPKSGLLTRQMEKDFT